MKLLKKNDKEVDIKKLNDVIGLSRKILNIAYILFIVLSVYIVIKVNNELHITRFLLTVLKIVSPLFIGVIVAWLFNPFVTYLQKKGIEEDWGPLSHIFCLLVF